MWNFFGKLFVYLGLLMELYGTLKEMMVNEMTVTSNMSGLLMEHIIEEI